MINFEGINTGELTHAYAWYYSELKQWLLATNELTSDSRNSILAYVTGTDSNGEPFSFRRIMSMLGSNLPPYFPIRDILVGTMLADVLATTAQEVRQCQGYYIDEIDGSLVMGTK